VIFLNAEFLASYLRVGNKKLVQTLGLDGTYFREQRENVARKKRPCLTIFGKDKQNNVKVLVFITKII
jgi:hypothetical protein